MSQLTVASVPQLRTIQRLLRMGRFAYGSVPDEDLPDMIAKGATVLAGERDAIWGVLVADPEARPPTLPAGAPNRAQLRALAMRHGPWLEDGIPELVIGLERLLPDRLRPLMISTYATETWLHAGLMRAGFDHADTVVYFRLNLPAAEPPVAVERAAHPALLRPATLTDTHTLADLDAEIFDALWHFGAAEIVEMQVRGRVVVATVDGEPAGYSALLTGQRGEAHLARLGVHPRFQRLGVGRLLLDDAVHFAQREGFTAVALNTQVSNLRSQTLYGSLGFAPSGIELPVLTLLIP